MTTWDCAADTYKEKLSSLIDKADADNRVLNSEFASLQNEKARLDKDLNTITVQNQSLQRSISAMRVKNAADKGRQLKAQSRLAGLNKQVKQIPDQNLLAFKPFVFIDLPSRRQSHCCHTVIIKYCLSADFEWKDQSINGIEK